MEQEEIRARLNEILPDNPSIENFQDIINQVMEMDDEMLTEEMTVSLITTTENVIADILTPGTIQQLKANFDDQGIKQEEVVDYIQHFGQEIQTLVDDLKPSDNQRRLLNAIFNPIINAFTEISDQYHNYHIILPMTLDEGAQEPTYAHKTDAAADLYAADTMVLPAHSLSNMVRTGVHIQLPEGWVAMIFPRSSIGAKTGLRLSNSAGIIDSGYLGPLGVLYDNLSDSDYTINKGDRIAQLMVMPNYHFKAKVVDQLQETDRSSGGFGSTGK